MAGFGVGRSTGAREPFPNLFGRGNRVNQTSGTEEEANRPENRDRRTLTGGVGPGLIPAELPGEPAAGRAETSQWVPPRRAEVPAELGSGRRRPELPGEPYAGRPPSVNSDGSGDTIRQPVELPGQPMPARGMGQGGVRNWLDGVNENPQAVPPPGAFPASPQPEYASREGSVAGSVSSVETRESQRTVGSQRREEARRHEVAGLQRQLTALRLAQMAPGFPPPPYASQDGSVASVETGESQRTVGSQRREEARRQEVAGLQRQLAESARREAAATREAARQAAAADEVARQRRALQRREEAVRRQEAAAAATYTPPARDYRHRPAPAASGRAAPGRPDLEGVVRMLQQTGSRPLTAADYERTIEQLNRVRERVRTNNMDWSVVEGIPLERIVRTPVISDCLPVS